MTLLYKILPRGLWQAAIEAMLLVGTTILWPERQGGPAGYRGGPVMKTPSIKPVRCVIYGHGAID